MRSNILIIGAGGVAHVAAHKAARHRDELGRLCIASRRRAKCDAIARSIEQKLGAQDPGLSIRTATLDAMDVAAICRLIEQTQSQIVLNVAAPFVNMSVLEACLQTGAAYIDTAAHEEPLQASEDPPWYAHHEWKRRDRCRDLGVTAILGAGFDPGVVNAYCACAANYLFDTIRTIDILDVNAGRHGRYFATNFDPEINLREFNMVWSWIGRRWVPDQPFSVRRTYDFPVVGPHTVYLGGHDELHSLSRHLDVDSVRFWMGFSDHSINVLTVLRNLGMTSEVPVTTADGIEVVPLKVLKAVLPDPMSLAPDYTGHTCIGTLIEGDHEGEAREVFLFNVCDHGACFREVGQHAIFYTAGVPAVAAARLIASGEWDVGEMRNIEELDPVPFLDHLDGMGLLAQMREGGQVRRLLAPSKRLPDGMPALA